MTRERTAIFKALDSERGTTTAEEVVARLRDMIHSGELALGDRLPPERDLAKLLGVSRPTLRAGIRTLTAVGILQSKQGAGTFVAEAEESPTLDAGALRILCGKFEFGPGVGLLGARIGGRRWRRRPDRGSFLGA